MRLWLARHATVVEAEGLCYGRLEVSADAAATEAAALQLHIALPAGVPVRCSPARRCRDLGSALAALRPGLPVDIEPDLHEMDFGTWEGRRWDLLGAAVLEAWTRDFARHRPGGGESVEALLARVARALERDRRHDNDVLWITHAGVIRAARLLLSGVAAVERADQWPRDAVPFGGVESHEVRG